ncbi:Vps16, C-terminal region-domain-containing protein [Mycena galopus ATCC 62051]|nr:Vps16, C-terminal region-domain-containing protein [Mycena galopus ATCC 62051]
MSAERPSSRWQIMQDGRTFYKRQQLYSIPGKLPNLSDYIVAGCRNGGPIALMRDHTKLVALGRSTPAITKAQIQIYSPAGEGLLLFSWDQGKIVRFGWTVDERLAILNEEGTYRLYDLQGDYQQYSLGNEAGEMGVIDARIHENGLVALTGSLSLLEVKGWEGTRPLTLANPGEFPAAPPGGLSQPPNSWAVIPPDLNISRHVEVLLSVDSTIFSVDNLESIDQRLSHGPFTHVSPSPNGKSLALLTFSGTLLVVSSDFQRTLAEFKTGDVVAAQGAVRQVEWCGIDAILVIWDNLAVVVGPFGDTLEYYYSGPTFAVTEPDGVRIMGPDVCDLIQKVPSSSASIFRPGSTSASAILYDAWESFSQRSPKADENIRSIRPELAAAVDECIEAAGQEWEPYWQRRLLNAAKFGRGFLDLHNPTDFINMGQTLKVLNAVRFYEIGIPLTHMQYIYASPSHLITRLTARNMHLLALRISTYLSIKPDAVLKHWASAKIMRSRPSATGTGKEADLGGDEDVCKLIVDKFEQLGGAGVSYADIAKRAWEAGRAGLATKLLDHEPRASDQVPLLLSMKEDRLALVKAVDSGDTDLVYHVLLHLHKRLPLGSFFRLIEDGGSQLAPASKLLEVYAREQNREMLRDFFYSDDRRVESAVLSLDEAATILDPTSKITAVRAAQKFFSEDKDRGFESKMMDESARLLTLQQQLEKDTDGKTVYFGLSVNETIRTLVVNGLSKRADKVKSDFKVPDKRFWYVKMAALISTGDFEGLDTFSKSKRSPIGYEPFVRSLVEAGYPKEAISYVIRCDSPKRADLYVECGEWRMAGKECKERGDKAKLDAIRQKCPNSLIAREFDQILASMK